MKIFVYYAGKPRDPHANGMAEEFIQRSTRSARRQMREIVPAKRPSAPRFAKLVSQPELVARDRVFPIGGA
jgi:23S rRNA (pseudouridine1915-N3)-methyltransferase